MGLADKAKDLAAKALDKAQELEKKAEPYVGKAKDTAEDLAAKASPHVQTAVKKAGVLLDQAGEKITQGVNTLANQLDKDKKPDTPGAATTEDAAATSAASPVPPDTGDVPDVEPAGLGEATEPPSVTPYGDEPPAASTEEHPQS